jgi:hypothetical protein
MSSSFGRSTISRLAPVTSEILFLVKAARRAFAGQARFRRGAARRLLKLINHLLVPRLGSKSTLLDKAGVSRMKKGTPIGPTAVDVAGSMFVASAELVLSTLEELKVHVTVARTKREIEDILTVQIERWREAVAQFRAQRKGPSR